MPGSAAQRRGSPVSVMLPAVRAVIRAVAREDLVTAGRHPRELDRVLVRLGAAVGEEEDVDVAGRDLGQLRAQPRARLGRHERVGVGQHRRLVLDRLDHALVAVADVDAHQLAVEVDEALAFRRPEVDALGPRDRNRIDLRLRRPLEERVLLRQRDHLVAGHRFLERLGRHVTTLFPTKRTKTNRHEKHEKDLSWFSSCVSVRLRVFVQSRSP